MSRASEFIGKLAEFAMPLIRKKAPTVIGKVKSARKSPLRPPSRTAAVQTARRKPMSRP